METMTRQTEWSLGVTVGATLAALAAMIGQQHWLVQLMLLLAATDIIVGSLAAAVQRTLSLDSAFRGVTKKTIALLIVGVGVVIHQQIGAALPIVEGIAGFYAALEGLSLLRHAEQAGVPVPQFLKERFAALAPKDSPVPQQPPRAA